MEPSIPSKPFYVEQLIREMGRSVEEIDAFLAARNLPHIGSYIMMMTGFIPTAFVNEGQSMFHINTSPSTPWSGYTGTMSRAATNHTRLHPWS